MNGSLPELVDQFLDSIKNPPAQQNPKLHKLSEHISAIVTEDNMKSVIGLLKGFYGLALSDLKGVDHPAATTFVDNISEFIDAVFSKEATLEKERQREELKKKREEAEKKTIITEDDKKLVRELKEQIFNLTEIVNELSKNKDDKENDLLESTRERLDEATQNAIRIADLMETEVRKQRETEETRVQQELIRRSKEVEEFDRLWFNYKAKYTKDNEKPTADLFKKFLVDVKGLTLEQIDKIKVSAIFIDDEISNFIEFDEELQRVIKEN